MVLERLSGRPFGQIAKALNADGVPTATGTTWQPAGVYQTFTSRRARQLIEGWGGKAPGVSPASGTHPSAHEVRKVVKLGRIEGGMDVGEPQ